MSTEKTRSVVLAVEATGPSPEEGHRIVELAAVEMVDGIFTYRAYRTYLNPERSVDPGALAIHGISEERLRDAPLFGDIAAELSDFLRGAELITHHAAFNLGFLEAEFAHANGEPLATLCEGIEDTYQTAKNLRRNKKNDIDTLVKDFDVLMPKRTLHGTELDAYLVGQIYLALKKRMLH